ncbi:MAG: quinone oxidoreductase, partial [Proteobacteria bacterium]|nr:quinone oxidoreductase [Pseudomonadota bacterium]
QFQINPAMKAFVISKQGSAKNLKLENIDVPQPRKNEVLIKHTAIGINHFDVMYRNGSYKTKTLPTILGMEACGVIEAVGAEVTDFKVGERVAYATCGNGAYPEKRVVNQRLLVVPPSNVSDVQVAGSLLKGLLAHSLLFRVYDAQRSKRILVHAAAGGVGHILCQWAKILKLDVIGTVGDDTKISFAKSNGCNHVINYQKEDFLKKVEEITQGSGVGVVYDGVGKDTILKSIDCLWQMGICVSYGESSGPAPAIDLNSLLMNSLYLTRPTVFLYKSKRVELVLAARELFKKIAEGSIKPQITEYSFTDIPKIHEALESRATTGSLVVRM